MKKYISLFLGVLFCLTVSISAQDQQSIWNSKDESFLIQVIEKPGNTPDDIFKKNLACKRLAIIGTDAAIPALSAMLSDDLLNHNARTALEAIPGAGVDQTLIDSLSNLKGISLVGVIDTLAMRKAGAAVLPLSDLLSKTEDNNVRIAIYNAWGYIASAETIDLLTAELKKDRDPDYKVNAALADAMLRAAAKLDSEGENSRAAELCAAVAQADLPKFSKNGALYNQLLYMRADAAEKLTSILAEGNDDDFEVALKTVREFSPECAEPIVKALLTICPALPAQRQAALIAALGDRTDNVSRKLVLPFVAEMVQKGEADVLAASIRALGHCGQIDPILAYDTLTALYAAEKEIPYDTLVEAIVALPEMIDPKPADSIAGKTPELLAALSDVQKKTLLAQIKVLELRRIVEAAPDLLAIANAEGVDTQVRDSAVAALSEIVTLEELNFLVSALEREEDEAKVDWYLRAACTRLPREECAASVVKMYEAADKAGKEKILSLLKQIGGPTALAAVAAAAGDSEMADKATEILGQWNTPEDAAPLAAACLKLAKSSSKYKTRAIRAYIRIPRQFDLPEDLRIKMARVAFDTATRPDDKQLIFEIFKRMITDNSVKAAMSYADQPEYSESACETAVFIAEKIKGTSPELRNAMQMVLETARSQELKDRASKVLERE